MKKLIFVSLIIEILIGISIKIELFGNPSALTNYIFWLDIVLSFFTIIAIIREFKILKLIMYSKLLWSLFIEIGIFILLLHYLTRPDVPRGLVTLGTIFLLGVSILGVITFILLCLKVSSETEKRLEEKK